MLAGITKTNVVDFKFSNPLYHPNVYPDSGRLCISILHAPGEDEMSGESAAIRWSPAQRVESILLSILSMLDDANPDSPANVDASKMYRENKNGYKEMAIKDREKSKKDIPLGFVMPTADAYAWRKEEIIDDVDDWGDSDAEFDFDSGSDDDEEGDIGAMESEEEVEEDKAPS
jgi:ubiquitin-conjugating enzyme E2 R